jgi:hypothetical protein
MIIVVWGDSFGLPHIVPVESAMSVNLPYTPNRRNDRYATLSVSCP